MGFTAPAIHYSSFSTLPLDLSSVKPASHSTNIQSKINHLLTKFLSSDMTNQEKIPTEIKENNPSSMMVHNNSTRQISTSTSFERLPFTEPYASTAPKVEKRLFASSAYQKHCTARPQRPSSILTNKELHSKSPLRKIFVRNIFRLFYHAISFDL